MSSEQLLDVLSLNRDPMVGPAHHLMVVLVESDSPP